MTRERKRSEQLQNNKNKGKVGCNGKDIIGRMGEPGKKGRGDEGKKNTVETSRTKKGRRR